MMIRFCLTALSCLPFLAAGGQFAPNAGRAAPPAHRESDLPRVCFVWSSTGNPEAALADFNLIDEGDPAYAAYKEGYQLILSERWQEATKKFAEVTARYPHSSYVVDAAYWSAYALKHVNRAGAVKAYEEFLHRYRRSTYLDDAVADLAELEASSTGRIDTLDFTVRVRPTPQPGESAAPIARSTADAMRHLSIKLRQLERINRRTAENLSRTPLPSLAFDSWTGFRAENLDPGTRVKLRALMAIGEMKDDPKSFATLKDVALNTKEPMPLRSAALSSLAGFEESDVLPVFVTVAESDASPELQQTATSCIVSASRDKGRALQTLTKLYRDSPPAQLDRRIMTVDAIASLGDEHAVNFLSDVALTSDNSDLAVSAIDGIGRVSTNKDQTVERLVHIFSTLPPKRNEERVATLYVIADVGNNRAIDFLSTVALSNDDVDTRGDAIYLLGTIGGEKARTVLYRVLTGK